MVEKGIVQLLANFKMRGRSVLALFYDDYRHDFVSRDFEGLLINLLTIEFFEYLLLQLNKFSNFSCNIDYLKLCPAPCTWDIKYWSYNYSF